MIKILLVISLVLLLVENLYFLHVIKKDLDGILYISKDGLQYVEYNITEDEICRKSYIYLKTKKVE